MLFLTVEIYFNQKNSPRLCLGVSDLPLLGRGRNLLIAVLGEVKYQISVFGTKAKMKLAKYPYGSALGIVGFKEFFIQAKNCVLII